MAPLFDLILAILVVAVAGWTIVTRDTFASAAGFIAYGLLLALVWSRLAAPDVALTEATIGSGLMGGLLLGASARSRRPPQAGNGGKPTTSFRLATAAICILVTAWLGGMVLLLPDPAPTLAGPAVANMAATGLDNPVTAVLMAYRAIDTLLEVVVLLLALIGVWCLAPDRAWGGRPGLRILPDTDGTLTFVAQLLVPIGILVGIHIFWIGSVAPGGEFQGATILAAMWILTMLASLTDAPAVKRRWLRFFLIAGPAVFVAVGLVGLALAGAFLAYPAEHAKLLILTIEVPLTLSISGMLALLVAGPPERPMQ